jgi:hypothetical protein
MASTRTFNKYSRKNFYIDSTGRFNLFKFDYDITTLTPVGSYIVSELDVGKPWIIAWRVYNQSALWWFLMRYNRVKDFETDLYPGREILFPSLTDYFRLLDRYAGL